MVTITMNNNNTFQLSGNERVLLPLYKSYKVKHPRAFYIRKSGACKPNWDGCIDYITERGYFKTGLFPGIIKYLEGVGEKIKIEDNRKDFDVKPTLVTQIGNNKLRGNQKKAVASVIFNEVGGIPFYNGILNTATNSGKTTMMAAIYLAFRKKIPCMILLKDADLFNQFKTEMPLLLPGEDISFIRGKDIRFANITVAMVQTLSPKSKLYQNQLSKYGMVLVDEADEGDSKTYKTLLTHLFNAKVRVGLSGSIFMSDLKKDLQKNMNLRSFFGDEFYRITKKDMVKLGYSTNVKIRIWPGSDMPGIKKDYQAEYDRNITHNKKRIKFALERMEYMIRRGRLPALVVYRFHDHGKLIFKIFKKKLGNRLNIVLVHGDTKDRKKILEDYRDGKIDILIGSFIIKRGKNFPYIRYIQNQSATDSQETISQIMGRGERKHETKTRYDLDDFFDEGIYLKRHSKHRLKYYKAEGFKVLEKYK